MCCSHCVCAAWVHVSFPACACVCLYALLLVLPPSARVTLPARVNLRHCACDLIAIVDPHIMPDIPFSRACMHPRSRLSRVPSHLCLLVDSPCVHASPCATFHTRIFNVTACVCVFLRAYLFLRARARVHFTRLPHVIIALSVLLQRRHATPPHPAVHLRTTASTTTAASMRCTAGRRAQSDIAHRFTRDSVFPRTVKYVYHGKGHVSKGHPERSLGDSAALAITPS